MGFGARPLNFVFVILCINCLQFIRSIQELSLGHHFIYIIIMYSQIIFYSKLLTLKTLRSSTEYIIIYFMSEYLIINLYLYSS